MRHQTHTNDIPTAKEKHEEIRWHYINQLFRKNEFFQLFKVPTAENIADIFTKPHVATFSKLVPLIFGTTNPTKYEKRIENICITGHTPDPRFTTFQAYEQYVKKRNEQLLTSSTQVDGGDCEDAAPTDSILGSLQCHLSLLQLALIKD